MAAAYVITRLSDGTEFAVSGFGGDVSKDRMADMLARALPLLQALKEKFPKDYDGIVSRYYDDYLAGKTEAESTIGARAKVLLIVSTLRPLADDAVLADLGAVYADQYLALGAKSPALCYQYASGVGPKDNFAADMPASLLDRENEINRRVVETAKKRQDVPAAAISDLWKKFGTQIAVKGVGNDQLKLLISGSVDPSRYDEYCRASATFYREIARLPSREAGILMRSVLADK